ncbi:MAG: hypothetical protein ACFBWO_16165, partial [Paracoccaceae bacterium]
MSERDEPRGGSGGLPYAELGGLNAAIARRRVGAEAGAAGSDRAPEPTAAAPDQGPAAEGQAPPA